MKKWDLDFIEKKEFIAHVKKTIVKYQEKIKGYDLKEFNQNIIDPIKLIFDKMVYKKDWKEIIDSEIYRQKDKANNNDIGYFHQNMFKYIKGCEVPTSGWDIIYENLQGIEIDEDTRVKKIYAELKNKHNTMNSSSASKTYSKMRKQITSDDKSACYLVEAISDKSKDVKWGLRENNERNEHKLIRKISLDRFYALITGDPDAFYKICSVLPSIIEEVIKGDDAIIEKENTVYEEIEEKQKDKNISFEMALYMLAFGDYMGFKKKE
jgi:hypothetical protein